MKLDAVELSIVIPLFNDSDVIEELFKRLSKSINYLKGNIEIILVDDGSLDGTTEEVKQYSSILQGHNLKLIKLMRNFGQMSAITAGVEAAKGKYTVLIDSDLQDRPEHILLLLEKIKEKNVPMVISKRKKRKDSFLKKLGSKTFHFLSSKLIDMKFPQDVGVFRIFETKYFSQVSNTDDKTTPILSLMYWAGIKYETIELDRDERFAGESGYNLSKMVSLALDRIFSFSTTPIRLATYIGIFIGLSSLILSISLIIRKTFFGGVVPGWTATAVIMLTSTGINLIFMGVIGEYLSRTYQETKKRPKYLVDYTKEFNNISTKKDLAS
jgi:dolichol-phosphate mannosyltransferase